MKRVLSTTAIAAFAVLVLLVLIGWLLPRHWHVVRSIAINAPSSTVHRFVGDLRLWPQWADSQHSGPLDYFYSGPDTGEGATRTWRASSGDQFGRITLTSSDPRSGVTFDSATNSQAPNGHGRVHYQSKQGFTEVTWEDEGELPPIIGGFMLDHLQTQLGYHFEEGLVKLKDLAESAARQANGAPLD